MSLLLPARLSGTVCARSLSRVSLCAVRTPVVRSYKTLLTPRSRDKKTPLPPPTPTAGSPSSQQDPAIRTPEAALERIKAAKNAEECLTALRHAIRNKIITPEIQRSALISLVQKNELDEALTILKTFKTTDLISHMILIYACTLAKRLDDFKALATIVGSIPGGEKMNLERLQGYFEDETTREVAKGDQGEEKGVKKKISKKSEKSSPIFDAILEDCVSLGDLEVDKYVLNLMENEGIKDIHYMRLIHHLSAAGQIDEAAELMKQMKDKKVKLEDPSSFPQAMWMYCAKNNMDEARNLFEEVRSRGLEELTPRLLGVFAQHNLEEAIAVLQRDVAHAGADAYAAVAQAMLENKLLERGIILLREVERLRLPLTKDAVLTAVKLFSAAGHVSAALKWVKKYEEEGEKTDNAINAEVMAMLIHHGMANAAREKVKEMRQKEMLSVEIYNEMVKGLVRLGLVDEAVRMVGEQMQTDGITPNVQSYENLMRCVEIGRVQLAKEVLNLAKERNITPSIQMYTLLCSGAALSGNFANVWKMLDDVEKLPNVTSSDLLPVYNDVLNSMVKLHNEVEDLEEVCKRMLSRNIFPNEDTYGYLIIGHLNKGTLDMAFGLFEKMKELRLTPTIRTLQHLQKVCNNTSRMEWYNKNVLGKR